MLLKNLCTAMFVLMMTACASLQPTLPPVTLQASLRQPCPPLPELSKTDGKTILPGIREVIRRYNQCADLHDATVEAWPK